MRKMFILISAATFVVATAFAEKATDHLVWVEGGAFVNTNSTNYFGKRATASGFYLGKYEVTQKEWREVMGSNPSQFKGDNLPVETVSWYDCMEYCNKRSLKEGLKPYYRITKDKKDPNNQHDEDDIKWTVTINAEANGYRLPTEAEWEYAAGGGRLSRSHTYSGCNEIDKVAWYWRNSGDEILTGLWHWPVLEKNHCRTKPVGSKQPNELGLYDMSGNVREFCWDWHGDQPGLGTDPKGADRGSLRVWKGGGWIGGDFCCESNFRGSYEPFQRGPDQGLRVGRNK